MDYKRQKPKVQRKPRDTGNLFVSYQPKQPSAWDVWQSLTPKQQARFTDLCAEVDAVMGYGSGMSKWVILDLAAHG